MSYCTHLALSMFILCSCLPLFAEQQIKQDIIWDTDQVIDQRVRVGAAKLSVAPGVRISFAEGGRLLLTHGARFHAHGTQAKPIIITGNKTGIIEGYGAELQLQHCQISGLSAVSDKKPHAINVASASGKTIQIEHCVISNCARLYLKPSDGSVQVSNSRFVAEKGEQSPSINTYGKGTVLIEGNTFERASISLGGGSDTVVRNNIVISAGIGGWRCKSMLVENNYVHQPDAKGSYCVPGATGILRNNVFRGGSWTTAKITGELIDNVLISLPHAGHQSPDAFDDHCTHEHICGMGDDSVVRRNIFIGASYGGVMGLGSKTCSRLEFSNNTLDMKNHGRCVMTNHLPEAPSEQIKIRNNIFMRCTGVQDEAKVKNAISCLDHNLWSAAPVTGERYERIFMDGLKFGDSGYGKHDLPADTGSIDPQKVVVNPDVEFPFSDEDLLSRKYAVADILTHYRKAYALLPNSPAINAGDVRMSDAQVVDQQPDMGAIEFVP